MKRNAQRIPTRLGGGNHGYFNLLLGTTKYNAVANTSPFYRPVDPGVFTPTNITTTPASTGVSTRALGTGTSTTTATTRSPNFEAIYEENLRLFLKVQTVETLLCNMLLEAFDEEYIQALRDATNMISLHSQYYEIPDQFIWPNHAGAVS